MAELLVECGLDLCTECCVTIVEEGYDKKAHPNAFLVKGIRLSDCADDSKTITLLQNKFPNLPILFPEHVDVPNTNGNSVTVWYIVSEEGIHRISVNRSLIGFFPTYYCVDGDFICLIADNKQSTVTFNTNPEIMQKYDAKLDRDWSGQTTISLVVGNNTVRINSGGGSVCREFFCSFIYRRPVTLKLFIGSPTSFNVENAAERWVEKKNCCPTLLYGIILFPLLVLWLFLILILIFAKCMTCCCFRGPIKRKVVVKDSAANRCVSYPLTYFNDNEASPLLQTPTLSSHSPQALRMENV